MCRVTFAMQDVGFVGPGESRLSLKLVLFDLAEFEKFHLLMYHLLVCTVVA